MNGENCYEDGEFFKDTGSQLMQIGVTEVVVTFCSYFNGLYNKLAGQGILGKESSCTQ